MSRAARAWIGLALLAGLTAGGYGLVRSGAYGLTVFVFAPVALGALASWVAQPESGARSAGVGALAVLAALFSMLLAGSEGLICLFMAAPLALPLGALGGYAAYRARRVNATPASSVAMLILLAPSLLWDFNARPTVFDVHSSIEIAAPPEAVWKNVVSFSDLPEPTEWYFHTGIAYPERARIVGSGPGAVRYCEFSTGPFVEPIEVWDEPRLLRFRVAANPAPMNEWSPYAKILPKHLHGYFISKQGQFLLTALPNGHTLLEGTTWYQHGLWPGEYWRWWSGAIIHRIHMRVLEHIRELAENRAG